MLWRAGRYFVMGTLAFLPAVVFLRFAQWSGPPDDERWMLAFKVATPFACVYLLAALWRHRPMNRLVTSTNLYLLVGGVMSFLHFWPGLVWYGQLRESALMLVVVLVGVFTTLATRAGFVGLSGAAPKRIRRDSLLLLSASLVALAVSWFCRGNPFWAVVLPMMVLSLLGHHLKKHLINDVPAQEVQTNEPA